MLLSPGGALRRRVAMAGGRPPLGAALVERLQGSAQAKRRLRAILQTLRGERTISSACGELNINQAAFFKLRNRWLQDAVESLEPRPRGRPRKEAPQDPGQEAALRGEVQRLERELRASHVREELAVSMPALIRRRREAEKKTPSMRRHHRRH
jgi:hypothetical protein